MRRLFFLLLFISSPLLLTAQNFRSPYDNADEIIKSSVPFNREKWFYEQRMYPESFIPEDAYEKAYRQREELRKQNGFFMAPTASYWTNIGPTPGYYFDYGNISGRVVTIKIDPVNTNTIYIGAAYGGVWKSTNGGLNWTPKTDFEVTLSSGALAIDPVNTNIIYYGTGEATYSGASYSGRGLLKSTNGGNNWTNYKTGLPTSSYFSRIVIKPGNSNYLLAAIGTSGLVRSTDAGVTWTTAVSGRCDDVVFSPDGTKVYIIGSGSGYKISTNGGTTFVAGTFPVAMGTRNHIAICKAQPTVLYAAVYTGGTIKVYKSTNSGTSFAQISTATNFEGGQAWYDFYMHVSPLNANVAFVGSIDVWRTTDGNTFLNVTNGYSGGNVHVDNHNMEFHPTNANILYCVNDGGVWYSSNQGTTWLNRNAGLSITQFYRMTSDPNNASHLAGGTQDNGTQRTKGTINWTAAFGGDGGEVCFHPKNSNYVLGETQNNGVRRSVNNGESWNGATSGLSGSGAWVAPIIAHPDSVQIFYTARQNVFKTTDMGASWFSISGAVFGGSVSQMAISRTKPKYIYAAYGSVVFRSTDGGYTFTNANTGLPSKTITSISVHPDSNLVCLVTMSSTTGNRVHKTTNGGVSWLSLTGNLPETSVDDGMFYYPGHSTNLIIVGTDVGVFTTTNNGTNWIEIANGLPNTIAMHLDYNQASGKLRVGTHGRGTWELNGPIGITNYTEKIPDNFYLSQNYPNPFNPATRINFGVKESGMVSLKVFDLLGREVSDLVSKNLKPGTYEVTFRGDNLTSGIYFYKLTAKNFTQTKRLSLIK